LLFFASIVLHELGHSVVAISYGVPVNSITLFIFGGVAQTARDADSAAAEFWIAIAGPLVSLVLAGLFYVAGNIFGATHAQANAALGWLATINLAVAVFNMLPGFPLDGGRVFRAAVWGFTRDAARGMQWAIRSGKLVAYGLMLLGFFVAVSTGLLLDGAWLALIGWFLLTAAEASGRQYALEHIGRGGRARDVMDPDVPLIPAGLSVQQWLDEHVLTHGQRSFLVQENDQVVGLVSLTDTRKLPRDRWHGTGIVEIMTPRNRMHTVPPTASLAQVLQAMERYGVNQLPVADGREVMGWIDRDRLLRAIRIHAELGK
jgi:Zn-dependent protease/predicted transcriptional regulator